MWQSDVLSTITDRYGKNIVFYNNIFIGVFCKNQGTELYTFLISKNIFNLQIMSYHTLSSKETLDT